ncbi:MAG: hypothetical protein IJW06_00615 [Clostridia bacterium]|nr:hypothetical protein [Clostridia bacterium]
MTVKVLVLSCNTGQGHNSAANAIREKFLSLGHECDLKDALRYNSKMFSKGISESYNKIVLHAPKAFGAGYNLSKAQTYKKGRVKSPVYAVNMTYSKNLFKDIVAENYDAVVCTHIFPAQALTHAKHKHGLDVPIYFVATDYGYYPFCDELDIDKFFIASEKVVPEYISRKIPKHRITATGIPVADRFLTDIPKDAARAELGLSPDRFLCLIMSGSMGFGNIYSLIDRMLECPCQDFDILVLAGNNHKLKDGINENYASHSNIGAIGFTDKVHLYMKACDLVITKPGGLSSTEAMVSNVPMILTKPIPGCETDNYNLLTGIGAALKGKTLDEAVFSFESVLMNKDVRNEVVYCQKEHINGHAAQTICELIINK